MGGCTDDVRIKGGAVPVFHVKGNDAYIPGNVVHGQIAGLNDPLTERLRGCDDRLRRIVDPGVQKSTEGSFLCGIRGERTASSTGDRQLHGVLEAGNTFGL